MKKFLFLLIMIVPAMVSCDDFMSSLGRQGTLQIRFADGTAAPSTRAGAFPDTNDFILLITDSRGNSVYEGLYGAVKESLSLNEGDYTVSAVSGEFSAPLFDAPQYGDTQVARIKSGKTTVVTLTCVQTNSGIRLKIDPAFLTSYPDAVLFLKATSGKLMYSYSEKRIAYFQPGTVNLNMVESGSEKTLFTRRLEPQQVLTLNLGTGSQSSSGGVSVKVDTTRNWLDDHYDIGGGSSGGGNDLSDAYSVAAAKSHAGEQDVWVYGYIVGGDLSSSKCSFDPPFSARTNLVIATKSSCTEKSSCLSVQLAKGDIRDALNLVDNPENLGRQIFLKGDIVESYYGIPGIQNISEYRFK